MVSRKRVNKIVKYSDLNNVLPKLFGKKVLVGGCFDLLHIGHLRFLKAAKKEGEILIVALESDEFIKKKKKRLPFHSQIERGEILASLTIVDLVILLPLFSSNKDYFLLVKKISPQIIGVVKNDPLLEIKRKQAHAVGAHIKIFPFLKGFSSTNFLEKLKKLG